jgi:hypothetical protein
MVTAQAELSAGSVYLWLTAREEPTRGTWRYNLRDGLGNFGGGRLTGMTGHMDALRAAANICAGGYEPGTAERGLLEQFAAGTQ